MRTFVTCLAVIGLVVTVLGSAYREGLLVLVGVSALAGVLVVIGQGEVRR